MDLFHSINRRKSCRKYDMKSLNEEQLLEIREVIKEFDILNNTAFNYRLETKIKGKFLVEAPHYLIISGKGEPGELENIGFLFEHLILWFDEHDIGSVWLGSATGIEENKNDIIGIAFGYSTESVHREENQFKRKKLKEITNAPDDPYMKAILYAPSGMNLQPWYFEKSDDHVLVYKQKLKLPFSKIYKLTDLDMGIALCHYQIASKKFNKEFHFERKEDNFSKKGYVLFGEIK